MGQFSKVGLFFLVLIGGLAIWYYLDWKDPKLLKKDLIEVVYLRGECWEQPEGNFKTEYGGSLVWWELVYREKGQDARRVSRYGSIGSDFFFSDFLEESQHKIPAGFVSFHGISEKIWKKEIWEIDGQAKRRFSGRDSDTGEFVSLEYDVPASCKLFVEERSPCFKAPGIEKYSCKD